MTTYPMHYSDNANSWHRIMQMGRLYWPGLKPGVIVCAAFPLVAVFLSALIYHLTGVQAIVAVLQWPISILLYLSPIMLTKRDYRYVSAQLPVTAGEKLGFLLLTFWVIMPAIIYLSNYVGNLLSTAAFGSNIEVALNHYEQNGLTILKDYGCATSGVKFVSFIATLSMIAIVLYYVVTAKKNRPLAAIVSMIVVNVVLGMVTAIYGAAVGFYYGYTGAGEHIDDAAITASIVHSMIWIVEISLGLIIITGLIYLFKLYKRLRNCGF